MHQFHIFHDDDWEQFCSSEINSVLEQVECIISANPPRNLLEMALTRLSQIIKFSTHLSWIQIWWIAERLDPRLVSTVCEALQQSTAQQKIKVEFTFGTALIDDIVLPIANLMKNCTREIGIDIYGGDDEIQDDETSDLFADALRNLSGAVKGLKIANFRISDDEACVLAEYLKVNATLDSLSLENNDIGVKGAKALAGALEQSGALTKLDLSDNSIGDDGAEALASALKQNGALTKLDLSGNSIGDDGAEALASALKQNGALTELDLLCNSIGEDGAKVLACALKQNETLTKLDLSYNSIGDEGAEALAGALKQNDSLTTLELSSNSIGDEGAIALGEAIAYNVTLDILDLGDNGRITEKVGIEALANGLNRNSTLTDLRLSWDHAGIAYALRRNRALLKEAAWMERFSDQDIVLKSKMLSNAMERYSMSNFRELTFLFLQRERATLLAQAESAVESEGPAPKRRRV